MKYKRAFFIDWVWRSDQAGPAERIDYLLDTKIQPRRDDHGELSRWLAMRAGRPFACPLFRPRSLGRTWMAECVTATAADCMVFYGVPEEKAFSWIWPA